MPGRPETPVTTTSDVLSDVLRSVHLTGAVYFDFTLSPPWVMTAPPSREVAAIVMPGAQRVIEYHLIARGSCWARRANAEPIRLNEGDLIVFPQGHGHTLSSSPELRAEPDMSAFTRKAALPMVFDMSGGGSERARVVCAFLGIDERPYNPLLQALPDTMHLPAVGPHATSGWLATLLSIAVSESGRSRAGGENILSRIAELVFVEAIRLHLERLPETRDGWLAGLRDPVVGQALATLHAAPAEPWTVERLARAVGASRSVLAERFAAMTGHPPMQYLALWRMQLASRELAEGRTVAEVASVVGYESEAAFSRAFKKLVGHPPSTWRRSSKTG
jgi:AraC-like DNA-binding protein